MLPVTLAMASPHLLLYFWPVPHSVSTEHTQWKFSTRIYAVDPLFNFQVYQGWPRRHQKHHWKGKTSVLKPLGSWLPTQPPGGSSPSLAEGRQWALLNKVSGGGSVGGSPGHGEQWSISLGHRVSPAVLVAVVPEVLDAPGFGCTES